MSPESTADLSKSIIETVGIITSFFAVSTFFFMGKIDGYVSKCISILDNYEVSSAKNKIKIKKLRDMDSELPDKIADHINKCKKCKKEENQKIVETNYLKITESLKKSEEENSIIFKKIYERRMALKIISGKADSLIFKCLLIFISILLSSILLSILAYVRTSSILLFLSTSLIIVGIVITLATWALLYKLSVNLKVLSKITAQDANLGNLDSIQYEDFREELFRLNEIIGEPCLD